MEKQTKYYITIGLSKEDMKTPLNYSVVEDIITKTLLSRGVLGFNLKSQKGFWKGEAENSLEISFIDTFGIEEEDLIKSIKQLKEALEQETIILEKQIVEYDFI